MFNKPQSVSRAWWTVTASKVAPPPPFPPPPPPLPPPLPPSSSSFPSSSSSFSISQILLLLSPTKTTFGPAFLLLLSPCESSKCQEPQVRADDLDGRESKGETWPACTEITNLEMHRFLRDKEFKRIVVVCFFPRLRVETVCGILWLTNREIIQRIVSGKSRLSVGRFMPWVGECKVPLS